MTSFFPHLFALFKSSRRERGTPILKAVWTFRDSHCTHIYSDSRRFFEHIDVGKKQTKKESEKEAGEGKEECDSDCLIVCLAANLMTT